MFHFQQKKILKVLLWFRELDESLQLSSELTRFLLESPDDIDIKLRPCSCLASSSYANYPLSLYTITLQVYVHEEMGFKKKKIKIDKGSFNLNEKLWFRRGCINAPSEAAPAQLMSYSIWIFLNLLLTFEVDPDDFSADLCFLVFK